MNINDNLAADYAAAMNRLKFLGFDPVRLAHLHGTEWVDFEALIATDIEVREDPGTEVLRCPRCEDYEVTIEIPHP